MTENEAVERLKCMRLFMEINDRQNESKFLEDDYVANSMAIQALEEIHQYRAIGTVEGYKRALEISKENFRVSMEYKAKVQEFEAIGTIDEFKALKESDIPIIHGKAELELHDKKIREKAIDDFVKAIKESQQAYIWCCTDSPAEMCDSNCEKCWLKFGKDIDKFAEQLKGNTQ